MVQEKFQLLEQEKAIIEQHKQEAEKLSILKLSERPQDDVLKLTLSPTHRSSSLDNGRF